MEQLRCCLDAAVVYETSVQGVVALQQKIVEPLLWFPIGDEPLLSLLRSVMRSDWFWEVFHIPIMLSLVCSVIPKVQTLERVNRSKVCKLLVDHVMTQIMDEEVQRVVRDELAELAWDGFARGKFAIPKDDLSKLSFCDQISNCGLLEFDASSDMFYWLHVSIRDYLAAEHVCSDRFNGDLVTELKRCLELENRDLFFGFICGIGGRPVEFASNWFPTQFEFDWFGDVRTSELIVWVEEDGRLCWKLVEGFG